MSEPLKLDADLQAGVEAFINHRDEPPRGRMTQSEAVNLVVRDWLTGQGYLALPGQDGIVRALEAADVPRTITLRDEQ